jgi:hypothetical protein
MVQVRRSEPILLLRCSAGDGAASAWELRRPRVGTLTDMSDAAIAGYELWDTKSGNLLDDFDTEAEALEAVRGLIALNGPMCTEFMALTRAHRDGRMMTLALGAELAARAQAAAPGHERRPV